MLFLTSAPSQLDNILTIGLVAVLALMVIAIIVRKAMQDQKEEAVVPSTVGNAEPVTAPGSAGRIKIHNVEPKTAAMLMAIVADKLGKPINELRFISIKEVEK